MTDEEHAEAFQKALSAAFSRLADQGWDNDGIFPMLRHRDANGVVHRRDLEVWQRKSRMLFCVEAPVPYTVVDLDTAVTCLSCLSGNFQRAEW